jgi:L-ascorbate metabolism protein UlaG (beta-lactamase superfamily)
MTVRITHIGGPTALIEVGKWRLLTDPTFAPPGRRYSFGWGSSSRKLTGPAITATDLGPIDAVLVGHDHHGDNLDSAGRALLPAAGAVLTTTTHRRRPAGRQRPRPPAHGRPPCSRRRDGPPPRSPPPPAATAHR